MTRLLLSGGRIFDGTGAPLADGDIVIADGIIEEVGLGLDGDVAVDLSGCAVLPGLFDCHVHVTLSGINVLRGIEQPFSYRFYMAAANLRTTLCSGVTSVRDAAGADLGMQAALRDGLISGPRMQISLGMLSQTGGHGDEWFVSGCSVPALFPTYPGSPDTVVDGPHHVRGKVRELVRAGADVLKVATSGGAVSPRSDPRRAHFRPDELAEIAAEADAAGLFVMAHAHSAAGVKNAVNAGFRSIEHGTNLDDEAIDLMLEHGTWLVPTLGAAAGLLAAADNGEGILDTVADKARELVESHQSSFRKAASAGVRIALGSDAGVVPHGSNLAELSLMVDGGLTPHQALVAATSSAAELMGVSDELGSIEAGKRADLVVVHGDPLDVATLPDRIAQVYIDGRCVHDRVGEPSDGEVVRSGAVSSTIREPQ